MRDRSRRVAHHASAGARALLTFAEFTLSSSAVLRAGFAIGLGAGLAACGGGDAAGGARAVEIGREAPAYAATTLAGDSVSLAELRGRAVLLNIWATWCHPCRAEIPVLQALHERHEARGLTVVGVSIDVASENDAVADFAREFGMTYPVWRDPDGRVSTLFSAMGVPATYLLDRDGTLRWRKIGPIAENDTSLARALADALDASAP